MNRIKEVIKEQGFTITSLAGKLGIARESLSRMIVSPSYPTLEKISNALNVPIWQLFVSPVEVTGEGELTALIQHKGDFYKASTIEELEQIVAGIKDKAN
ncbi:helix-turn-helix domain-containing protein [Bacteroides sp. 14(A)]|uniref:helix-turn-helix domain-containing protein n=1 Tax=Bacteroides sp. 14(A) TaxID=1163670 RepID=UPI000472532C|nr:helix-turn-helix transcriptional regulator [Bacteroides sp. 14(A)]